MVMTTFSDKSRAPLDPLLLELGVHLLVSGVMILFMIFLFFVFQNRSILLLFLLLKLLQDLS